MQRSVIECYHHYGQSFDIPWQLLRVMSHVAESYTKDQGFYGIMGISREIYSNHTGPRFKVNNPECCIEVAANQLSILRNRMSDITQLDQHYCFVLAAYRTSAEKVYASMSEARLAEGLPGTYRKWRESGKPSGQWQEWEYTSTFAPLREEVIALDYVKKVLVEWNPAPQNT